MKPSKNTASTAHYVLKFKNEQTRK